MKLHYYPETDSLYIELNEHPGADTIDVSDGLVIDVDEEGNPVGIDIDRASLWLDLDSVDIAALPATLAGSA